MEQSSFENIHSGLEKVISGETSAHITKILDSVNQLSDVGKLLLYLKLPKGTSVLPLNSRSEKSNNECATIMCNWIKSHLVEHQDSSLSKQELYDNYRSFIEQQNLVCASMLDFCKTLKVMFPNIRDRRLGKRGSTKYVYCGIQYSDCVPLHQMPDITVQNPLNQVLSSSDAEARDDDDACAVVLDWARKLCDRQFATMSDLAEYLIHNHYVSLKSREAFSVIAAAAASQHGLSVHDALASTTDAHAQLRRSLQEREAVSRLRSKMEEEKSRLIRYPTAAGVTSARVMSGHKTVSSLSSMTPPKRILPKSESKMATIDTNAEIRAAIERSIQSAKAADKSVVSVAANTTPQFVLLSPHSSHIQSPVILFSPTVKNQQQLKVGSATLPRVEQLQQISVASATVPHDGHLQQIRLGPSSLQPPSCMQQQNINNITGVQKVDQLQQINMSLGLLQHGEPVLASLPHISCQTNNPTVLLSTLIPASSIECRPVGSTITTRVQPRAIMSNTVRGLTFASDNTYTLPTNAQHVAIKKCVDEITGNDMKLTVQKSLNAVCCFDGDGYCDVSNLIDMFVDGKPLVSSQTTTDLLSPTSPSGGNTDRPPDRGSDQLVTTAKISVAVKKPSSASSSRSVMSLLLENRCELNESGRKAYLKDPRPVASLLREERERQLIHSAGLPGNSNVQLAATDTMVASLSDTKTPSVACKSTANQESMSLLESLLTSKTSRRPSLERPLSVSDLLCAVPNSHLATSQTTSCSLAAGSSRKRPHTALNDPLSESWSSSFTVDHSLNVDLIEKSALDELMELGEVKEETAVFSASFTADVDSTDAPPVKFSFVNRSVENMTLQQLQQARLRNSLRTYTERTKRYADASLLGERPTSMLGEPMASFDGLVSRDSRPNTVVGYWEQPGYRDGSSSVDSCASAQLPAMHYTHFTPIQTLADNMPTDANCDVVRPTAKNPVTAADDSNVAAVLDVEVDKQCILPRQSQCNEQRTSRVSKRRRSKHNRIRHKSADRSSVACITPLLSTIVSPTLRTDSPLSTEICDIINGNIESRLHSSVGDYGAVLDDSSSAHRSYSVPASVMLDYCLCDDLDVFTTGSEPLCDNLHHAADDRTTFWGRPVRGDHMISGVSFRPVHRSESTPVDKVNQPASATEVSVHTPPSSQNPSPNFDAVFQTQDTTVVVDTPTSLVSGPMNDSLVDELFGSCCESRTSQLLDWDCS